MGVACVAALGAVLASSVSDRIATALGTSGVARSAVELAGRVTSRTDFDTVLATRLEAAGATPAEQAQAIGILQSYVQTGTAAKDVQDVIASGVSAYLASYRITMLVMAAAIAATGVLCYGLMSCARLPVQGIRDSG